MVYYFFEDHLGSARVVTNSTGTVVEDSDYYPFGGERVFTDTLDNNYKFTGHERDAETGLDHTLYRKLSSSLGRWTTSDPVMASPYEAQSLNRYSYVVNNPTNLVDPMGQFHWVYVPGYGWCRYVDAFLDGSAFQDFFCFPEIDFDIPFIDITPDTCEGGLIAKNLIWNTCTYGLTRSLETGGACAAIFVTVSLAKINLDLGLRGKAAFVKCPRFCTLDLLAITVEFSRGGVVVRFRLPMGQPQRVLDAHN